MAKKIFELANGDREAWSILIQRANGEEGLKLIKKLDDLQINGAQIRVLWNDWALEDEQFFGVLLDDFANGNRDLNDLVVLDDCEDYYNNYRQEAYEYENASSIECESLNTEEMPKKLLKRYR